MNKSQTLGELAKALNKAQAEFDPAPVNSSNPHLRNKYADLGSIIETAKPVLAKYGLSVSQMVFGEGSEIGITNLLMHVSGEWLESSVTLPVSEEKGIKPSQVAGSIISYLRRYSLAAMLGIYVGGDDDGEGHGQTTREAAHKPTGKATTNEKGNPVQSPPFSLVAMVETGLFESPAAAANVFNRSPYVKNSKAPDSEKWQWHKLYRAWRDAGKSTDEAIEKANTGEIPA